MTTKKNVNLSLAGLVFLAAFTMVGCITTPSFNSLPETDPNTASFVGSWISYDAGVIQKEGSFIGGTGTQYYTFYADGTGEILDFNDKNVLTARRVFQYRVSDTLIGFQFMKGTAFNGGGSFSRPYTIAQDKRKITFPYLEQRFGSRFSEFSIEKRTPSPLPPPPAPPATVPPGEVYYSYDGTGHVYYDNAVFYLCSNGKPAGYVEGGVIYDFSGKHLGFFDRRWIYEQRGRPIGALDPMSLGLDAQAKKPVTKAEKQSIPTKQAKTPPAARPPLKNGYFGGTLRDIF